MQFIKVADMPSASASAKASGKPTSVPSSSLTALYVQAISLLAVKGVSTIAGGWTLPPTRKGYDRWQR